MQDCGRFCCVVLWYGTWHGIAYRISGMVLCTVFYVVWNRAVKYSIQCFIISGVWQGLEFYRMP